MQSTWLLHKELLNTNNVMLFHIVLLQCWKGPRMVRLHGSHRQMREGEWWIRKFHFLLHLLWLTTTKTLSPPPLSLSHSLSLTRSLTILYFLNVKVRMNCVKSCNLCGDKTKTDVSLFTWHIHEQSYCKSLENHVSIGELLLKHV